MQAPAFVKSRTIKNVKNGPKVARENDSQTVRKGRWSKTDSRYWMEDGRLKFHGSPDYSVRIQAEGKREWFSLGTPNKRTAAAEAARIFSYIHVNGLQKAISEFKPKSGAATSGVTIGAFIDVACQVSSANSKTLSVYAQALRCIVAEIKGIDPSDKNDFTGGGAQAWRTKVNSVKLDSILPSDILAWKNARLRANEANPIAQRSAIVTTNSIIRNARSLFGKKLIPFISTSLSLPPQLPFDGITLEKSPSRRYVSKIDAREILTSAKSELLETDPEAFKVIVLALVCGLRRAEIDNLLKVAFDFKNSILRVEFSEFHKLKSEDSAGEIDLDEDTVALFKDFLNQKSDSNFVIEWDGHTLVKPVKGIASTRRRYRCEVIFDRVIKWLRKKGVKGQKPLHTLRKEIGSIITSEHGIYAASRFLRHSDIQITASTYTDKKKVITPQVFSGLLAIGKHSLR